MSIYCLKWMNTFPGAVVSPEQTDRCWEDCSYLCSFESRSNLQAEPRPAKKWAGTTMGKKVRAQRWRDTQDQHGVHSIKPLQLFFLSSLPDAASLEVWMAHELLGRRQSSLVNT